MFSLAMAENARIKDVNNEIKKIFELIEHNATEHRAFNTRMAKEG